MVNVATLAPMDLPESQYIYPILGLAVIAVGIHWDHAAGDILVGFGAALGGATIKGALPTSLSP